MSEKDRLDTALPLATDTTGMTRNREQGFATRAIHFGYNPMDEQGALTPPLHLTSTFAFESAEAGGELFAGERQGHVYSRISNPTTDLLERRIADLEGAEAGLATASGMGAITSVLWTLLSPGDEVLVDKTLYGCTFSYLRHGLEKFGITITHVDMTDPANLDQAITSATRVIYFETPANPNMRLVDIAAVSQKAKAAGNKRGESETGIKVVVDNTYATPLLTRPLELGADLVVHSATKYLGGHGDLVAGLVAGSTEDITNIRLVGMKDMTGAVMAPFNALLILRGIKTLQLRMARHCETSDIVARWLEDHPAVAKVHYPGLKSFEQHDLAKRQMANFGGIMAFELEAGFEGGLTMMNNLNLITRAVSLGDAESLIQHPASMTHSTYSPEERQIHGISDGLIRLSLGLEEAEDILADLDQSLRPLTRTKAA